MLFRNHKQALLSLAIAFAITGAVTVAATDTAVAQSGRNKAKSTKKEVLFPEATRKEPEAKTSSKLQAKIGKLIENYNKQLDKDPDKADFASVRTQADEILANEAANNYDKALAAQLAAQAAYNAEDTAAAIAYLKQTVELDALDNNGHYQSLRMLAQLLMQEEQYNESLTYFDKYLAETNSKSAEDLAIKGQALYQAERCKDAIEPLKQAVAATDAPKSQWLQLLMACYADTDQGGEAVKLAEQIASKSPDDIQAQMNLANMYYQNEQNDKAIAVLEKLRSVNKLTDEKGYRLLYITYANMDNREKDTIAVINDGLAKGILKPDQQTYAVLAQSYYYSEQIPQAIDAWQKAAPLSKDGETYLNLARVLHQEGRTAEAKKAAQAALDKGVKKPQDAKTILNLK